MLFSTLAEAYKRIEATTLRLEITGILAELFRQADAGNIDRVIYLTQGLLRPPYEGVDIGLGEKFVEEAIALSTGYSKRDVEELYRKHGDLGKVAEELAGKKRQLSLSQEELSVEKVYETFMKIAKAGGQGSQEMKIKLLAELLNSASPLEAKYIARFPLDQLRLGVGDPTILDALSSYAKGDKSLREPLERAYNLCTDLGFVGKTFFEKGEEGLLHFSVRVNIPIRPALAERLPSAEEIVGKIGKCIAEAKYDGFRCQIHKKGKSVKIFSRKLEETTGMFPEIAEATLEQIGAEDAILEGEALSYNEVSGEYLPFQLTMQRKRKYGIEQMAREFPLRVFAFDLLYADGVDYTTRPLAERRKKMGEILRDGERIRMSESIETGNAEEMEKFFDDCVSRGLEGIIAKDLNQPYIAGARKFAWIKLKRSYRSELADTVDVAIVGYYAGKGKRVKFGMGGLLAAVYDKENDVFKTVAKIGSGYTEQQMVELNGLLGKIRLEHRHARVESTLEPDFWVEPKYVVTVAADEITRSPIHTCGYALRFPRIVSEGVRADKSPEDATTVDEIIGMYNLQRHVRQAEETA